MMPKAMTPILTATRSVLMSLHPLPQMINGNSEKKKDQAQIRHRNVERQRINRHKLIAALHKLHVHHAARDEFVTIDSLSLNIPVSYLSLIFFLLGIPVYHLWKRVQAH
jgi:hypothetical protein